MVPIDKEQIRLLEQRLRGAGVDRRTFLKIAGAAMAAPAAGSLLAACGGDNDDDDTPSATSTAAGTGGESAATATTGETGSEASPSTDSGAATAATGETGAGVPDAVQFLNDTLQNGDPASHDFNADLYCNGVPQIWAGLLSFDQDFNPSPDWAESWEPNEDATMWTFHIRPDNTGFSNGDPVTAETFAYSWKRMLDPDTLAPYASILFDIKGAEDINLNGADPDTLGVRVVDDWTLEVDMIAPRGMFPTIVAYYACVPTHPESAEKGGNFTDPGEIGGPVISNGPFVLTEWEHSQRCTVEKNPNYWNASAITLEKINNLIVPTEQGILPYEAGEVDWIVVPGSELPRVQADPTMSAEVQKWVEPLIWKLLPQVTVAPFDDIKVRRALSHSIDRDRINELTNGGGDPAHCLVPPGLFGYFGSDFADIMAFDPEKALAELEGTKYEGGENWPKVTMILRNEAALNSNIMAEDLAAQIQESIGMEIEIQVMDFQAFRDLMFTNTSQLVFVRWYYDYPDPNNGYFDMFYSNKESGKRQAWSNKEFDELVVKGKEAADPDERLEYYRQAEQIMQDEVAYIPIVYRNAYDVYKPWVKGVPVNMQGFALPNGNIYVGMWNTVYTEGRPA
ncbi:MAG TPA: peptide ABC transporter substrate-binding protein [Thermomicrobiales bacterium]|nr:peptide ABC transporter substrate-binding protein [Thermomicrobiales bacterium]